MVRCLSTGVVRTKRGERGARRYLPGGWEQGTLPVNVFLVEHPEGLCLFDAGQTARAAAPGHFPRWYPFFRLARFELSAQDEVAPQLRSMGVDLDAVRWVVLSHLHTDHVGGIGAFAHARVLVSRVEWARACGLGGRLRGYLPQHWPVTVVPSIVDFPGGPVGPFVASFDLVGDGRLIILPTMGHTPGHMALLAHDDRADFLLCGDLARTATQMQTSCPSVADYCRRQDIVPLTAHDSRAHEMLAARHW